MVIEIEKEVFNLNLDFISINKLIQDLIYKRRYDLFIDISSLIKNEVYNRIDEDVRKIIEDYFDKHIMSNANIDYKVSSQSSHSIFEINEAIRYFNQPVYLILENSLNDGYFIDSLIANFKKASKKIEWHKNENWLFYQHAGGTTGIPNSIQSILGQLNILNKEKYKFLRVIVILDSDKEYPEMILKRDKQNIIEFLHEKEIKYHILEKREIENYIPDEVIKEIAFNDNDEYLNAYLNLTPIQKDFFDIEKGFCNKNYNTLSTEMKQIYEDNNDYKILRKGVDKNKWNNFKAEFPKLFQNKKTTQETLLNRTSHQENKGELKEILSKINELL